MSLSTVSLERRSNSVINLKRMDLSDSPVSGEDMESAFNPICPRVTHGGFDRHGPRRTGFAVWLIALVLGSLTMLLSVMVFNTAKMGFRSISTTSYVNVNYWPSVANNNGVHDVWPERQSRNSALADIGPKHLRLHLGPGYKNQASKSLSDTALNMPRNDAESWPPETPNWELCSSRSDPQTIRTSGSVFGYFSMYLRCPAAPSFQPVLYFDPPKRTKKPAGPNANGTSPELLIGVFSGCLSRLRRDTVRETWGRLRDIADAVVRLVFVLAHNCGKELASEQQEHGDLLYVDVRESYFTLTPKSLALLRAGLEMNAQYIMKTDDDSFIFVDRVVSELGRLRSSQGTQGHQPCLYWGRRCSVPLLSDYNNPKLPLFQTSVSKWYYPPHYLRHFEGTAYMCGAAYLLSAGFAARVLNHDEIHRLADEAPFLPEDASVGHLAGPEGWESCSCQDHRFILDARRFHGRHLFAPGVDDCQRADIFSHALSAHGLKPEQMQAIIDYDSPADQKCSFTNPGELPLCSSKCKHEASEFPPRNLHDPFDEWVWQDRLAPLQAQFPEINWQRRLESPPSRPRPDMGLIPLMSLLRAQHTPWCVRHSWAIQVAELMADLSYRRVLDCMMGMREIYVDPSTMQIKLNEESDTLVGYEENSAFERGIPCYADNMCDRCFLPESREGLFGSLCDPKTWTCKGYDASHQTKVASHKVLHALIGRFVHDTPDPQEDYRAAIDAALRLADMDVSKPRELPRMQAKALRLLYESFNGQECNNNWIASLAEAGETELVVEN